MSLLEKLNRLLLKYKILQDENKNLKNELKQLQKITLDSPFKKNKKVKKTRKVTIAPSLFE